MSSWPDDLSEQAHQSIEKLLLGSSVSIKGRISWVSGGDFYDGSATIELDENELCRVLRQALALALSVCLTSSHLVERIKRSAWHKSSMQTRRVRSLLCRTGLVV